MVESWQGPEAAAVAEKKQKSREEWVQEAARLKAELVAAEAQAAGPPIDLSHAPSAKEPTTVGFNWSMWTDEGCEMAVLGWAYRQRFSDGNRRPIGQGLMSTIGSASGIPGEADLAPRAARPSGYETSLSTTISPDKWAQVCIFRDDDAMSQADGTANASLWNLRMDKREWRPDEKACCDDLTVRFKRTFARMVTKGWLIAEPVLKFSPEDTSGTGNDGMPNQCHFTHVGMSAAEEKIKDTSLAHGAGSPVGSMTQRQRDNVRNEASWFYREFMDGAKAGT